MENIERACASGGVPVQPAPVDTTTIQSVPFMQMTERPDSRNVPRKDDHIELTALKFKGMTDSLDKFIDSFTKSVARSVEKQSRKLDRDRRSSTDSRNNRDSRKSRDDRRSYRSDQVQVQRMIDIGLEVEIVLEVGLEVEEDLSKPVLIATSQTMICLTVID